MSQIKKKFIRFLVLTSVVLFFGIVSAAPTLIKMDPKQIPSLKEDGDLTSLKLAIDRSLLYFNQLPTNYSFNFGEESYSTQDQIESLLHLKKFLNKKHSKKSLAKFIKKEFLIFRYSEAPVNGITFSSYYEYGLLASLTPNEEFRYPLYSRPPELVDVPLEKFDINKRGERVVGKVVGKELQAYYSREQIDSYKIFKERGLEIAWAKDPLEILFLQIQGSGWIKTPQGETYHIRYTGDNGHPYRSVGLYLIQSGIIPKENFSRQRMIDTLTRMSEDKRQAILNINPRYVFFEIVSDTVPIRGSLSVPLTAGRSIATDPKFYPPGALAWIQTQKPTFDREGNKVGTEEVSRLVLNQDEGGAIKGINRVDFFAGRGPEAKKMAENLWYPGEIYILIKRKQR